MEPPRNNHATCAGAPQRAAAFVASRGLDVSGYCVRASRTKPVCFNGLLILCCDEKVAGERLLIVRRASFSPATFDARLSPTPPPLLECRAVGLACDRRDAGWRSLPAPLRHIPASRLSPERSVTQLLSLRLLFFPSSSFIHHYFVSQRSSAREFRTSSEMCTLC